MTLMYCKFELDVIKFSQSPWLSWLERRSHNEQLIYSCDAGREKSEDREFDPHRGQSFALFSYII